MCARHIFVTFSVFLVLHQIAAPPPPPPPPLPSPSLTSSGLTTAVKLHRSPAFKKSSRDFELQRRRMSSSSSSSSLTKYSRGVKPEEHRSLNHADEHPFRRTGRGHINLHEASEVTFSGGNIDPSQHGVYARIRNSILRHASTFGVGAAIGVGVGLSAMNNFTHANIVGDSATNNSTHNNNNSSILQPHKEVENAIESEELY